MYTYIQNYTSISIKNAHCLQIHRDAPKCLNVCTHMYSIAANGNMNASVRAGCDTRHVTNKMVCTNRNSVAARNNVTACPLGFVCTYIYPANISGIVFMRSLCWALFVNTFRYIFQSAHIVVIQKFALHSHSFQIPIVVRKVGFPGHDVIVDGIFGQLE